MAAASLTTLKVRSSRPVAVSQSFTVLSSLAVAIKRPSPAGLVFSPLRKDHSGFIEAGEGREKAFFSGTKLHGLHISSLGMLEKVKRLRHFGAGVS